MTFVDGYVIVKKLTLRARLLRLSLVLIAVFATISEALVDDLYPDFLVHNTHEGASAVAETKPQNSQASDMQSVFFTVESVKWTSKLEVYKKFTADPNIFENGIAEITVVKLMLGSKGPLKVGDKISIVGRRLKNRTAYHIAKNGNVLAPTGIVLLPGKGTRFIGQLERTTSPELLREWNMWKIVHLSIDAEIDTGSPR